MTMDKMGMIWGKIAGAILGLLLFQLPGLVLGVVAGHFLIDIDPVRARKAEKIAETIQYHTLDKKDDMHRFWRRFSSRAVMDEIYWFLISTDWEHNRGKMIGALSGFMVTLPVGLMLPFGIAIGAAIGHYFRDLPKNPLADEKKIEALDASWGKIVLVLTGLTNGGILMAFFGLIGGHYIDLWRQGKMADLEEKAPLPFAPEDYAHFDDEKAFIYAAVVLSAKLAGADGRLTRTELTLFRKVFPIPGNYIKKLPSFFAAVQRSNDPIEEQAEAVADRFGDTPFLLETLMNILVIVSMAEGEMRKPEKEALLTVANAFSLDQTILEQLHAMHGGKRKNDPYLILGIKPGADNDTVKSAWKQLSRQNHPDTLHAKGVPSVFIESVSRKMAAINAAYDRIARDRGIKR